MQAIFTLVFMLMLFKLINVGATLILLSRIVMVLYAGFNLKLSIFSTA
jgi:hypothetical protein